MTFFKKKVSEKDKTSLRINALFLGIVALVLVVVVRLVFLQILNYQDLSAKAENQRDFSSVVSPERGRIFLVDRFNKTTQLAANGSEYSVYAVPKDVEDKEAFSKSVSDLLEVDYETLLLRVSKDNDPYEPVKSLVSEEKKIELEALGLSGLGFKEIKRRMYPQGSLASHVSGFLSAKNNEGIGQYGIEEFYDENLAGRAGFISGELDSFGANVINEDASSFQAINGDYIFLSIDPNVQFKIEDELKNVAEKYKAESGSIIVMEPSSGRILGMANYPSFDPNNYSSVESISIFKNKAVSSQYEPGSIMKPITMAIGIDAGVITPETTYEDKGFVTMSGYTMRNYNGKANGVKTMTEVLEMSLNTGTVFVSQKIPKDIFRQYMKDFGFGQKTGIDLPVEAKGDIRNLEKNREINFATASFGQGVATTPIQMLSSISVIANGGKLMKPRLVDQIFKANGSKTYVNSEEIRRVISEETAEKVKKMLVSVVKNGFDKAEVPGYFVAAKTGTAQIPSTDGKGGYSDEVIHSFIGFAPAYDARFSVLVILEKPQDVKYASQSLTGTFREVMKYLLNYYEVKPDYK